MAETKGNNYDAYSWVGGGYGNLTIGDAMKHESVSGDLDQNDTVQMGRLPIGAVLVGIVLVTDALGANTSVKVSTRVDGASVVDRAATAVTTSAVKIATWLEPVTLATEVDVVVTQTGSGTGVGTVTVMPLYINRGV